MRFALCSLHFALPPRRSRRRRSTGSGIYRRSTQLVSPPVPSQFGLALRDLGYIEGQNIAIEYRYSEGKRDREPELAAELVRLKVDIILVTGGGPRIRAAKNATKTIPIVMTGEGPILSRQA